MASEMDNEQPAYKPRLNGDTMGFILASVSTLDLLRCACVCTTLRQLCDAILWDGRVLQLSGTNVSGPQLLWLASKRLRGLCKRISVSDCEELTKAQIVQAVAASPALEVLEALRVGPGSWSAKHIERLVPKLPASLRTVRLDCRVETKNDLAEDSPLLSLFERPGVQLERLTLIADNVSRASPASQTTDGPASEAEAAAAAVDAAAAALAAASIVDVADVDAAYDQQLALQRLSASLRTQAAHLVEVDATSGALAVAGGVDKVLVPLLEAPGAALRVLSVCSLPPVPATMTSLAHALRANRSLTALHLDSNMIHGEAAPLELALAIEHHPTLTRLSLAHNPILDVGGVAIASALSTSRISELSLAFTGVADGTCEALALALNSSGCVLRRLNLTGNRLSTAGVQSLASGVAKLHVLDLGANILLNGDATSAVAKALPGSALRSLRLSGCGVDKKACGRVAAGLVQSSLTSLDVSSNHFGNDGSDELAWVLAQCSTLETLRLADCNLEDSAAEELLEALPEVERLQMLDLRWNRFDALHRNGRGISADARVDVSSQKQKTQAEQRAAKGGKSDGKGDGKAAYRPKWTRGQTSAERVSGSTSRAMG